MSRQVFALTSGRSGTRFLADLSQSNLRNTVCRHEPRDLGNPTLFGHPIYDHAVGRKNRIRALVAAKKKWVERHAPEFYVETSHALLKSYYDVVLDFFPEARFIHLVRDPIRTALSEAQRHRVRRHLPFQHYWAGGRRYFRWALTDKEPIFASFDLIHLSLFQRYVIQWIEIENRAMRFIQENNLSDRLVTLHSPTDLNDAGQIAAAFERLGLETLSPEIVISGRHNRTRGTRTAIMQSDEAEFRAVIDGMPDEQLEIFHHAPYRDWSWASALANLRSTRPPSDRP